MEQLDRLATESVLRAMAEAGVDLDQVVSRSGMTKTMLLRRMAAGKWKVVELGKIAKAIGCPPENLLPKAAA